MKEQMNKVDLERIEIKRRLEVFINYTKFLLPYAINQVDIKDQTSEEYRIFTEIKMSLERDYNEDYEKHLTKEDKEAIKNMPECAFEFMGIPCKIHNHKN